jgi:lipopolysaccharide export LptBFGC system permease protein LptF
MGTLGWYVLMRTTGRFVLMLLVFMAVLVGGQLALALGRGSPPEACVAILEPAALIAVSLALPLSLATAFLVVIGAMNRDGEFRALASCGISHYSVIFQLTPLLLLGIFLSALLSNVVLPRGTANMRANQSKLIQAAISEKVAKHDSIDVPELNVEAWANSATGHQLNEVFMFVDRRSDDQSQVREISTIFAPTASWHLSKGEVVMHMPRVQLLRTQYPDPNKVAEDDKVSSNGSIIHADLAHYNYIVPTQNANRGVDPESMSTAQLASLLHNWEPGKYKLSIFNNARLWFQLRFFIPLSLIAFVVLAVGLGLIFATADNLFGVVVIVLVVTGSTFPAIQFVKTQIDHPDVLHPAWLLWPPVGALLLLGAAMIWKPLTFQALFARPRLLFAKLKRRSLNTSKRLIALSHVESTLTEPTTGKFGKKMTGFVLRRNMLTLDKFIGGLGISRWIVVMTLGTFLIILVEFMTKMGPYVKLLGTSSWYLLPLYFLLRIPEFLLLWMPLSVVVAALLIAGPMLRQGTVMVLSASGIPPRRVFAGLIALALMVGLFSFVLKDQIVPRLDTWTAQTDAKIRAKTRNVSSAKKKKSTRPKTNPAGWSSGDCFWCAQDADPASGVFYQVAVFMGSANGSAEKLARADSLEWQTDHWQLNQVVIVSNDKRTVLPEASVEQAGLQLEYDPERLALAIRPDSSKTSTELMQSSGEKAVRIVLHRLLFSMLPFLCLLFALPRFISWENRFKMGANTIKSLLTALVPVAAVFLLGKLLISSTVEPLMLGLIVTILLLATGVWRWRAMRL